MDGVRFSAHLARHLPADSPAEELQRLHLPDLYLACACAEGLPLAHAAFEARLLPEVNVAVARLRLPPSSVDEVRQLVRQKRRSSRAPIRRPGSPPTPRTGSLSGWVRAAALWLALDMQRQRSNQDVSLEDSTLSVLVDPGDDPELVYLKTTYRAEFNSAFTQALTNLSPRERNTLRLKYLDPRRADRPSG